MYQDNSKRRNATWVFALSSWNFHGGDTFGVLVRKPLCTLTSYICAGVGALSFQKVTRASAAGGLKKLCFRGNTMTGAPGAEVTKVDPLHCQVRNVPGGRSEG